MRKRLPLVLAVLALVIALFAATPLSEAAPKWVKRALFAKNAHKVDGIHASRTPKPDRLLALDQNGQFPASVLPPTPAQTDRTAAFSKYRNGPVNVPNLGGPIAELGLPAGFGSYVVFAKAWFDNQGPATNAVECKLALGGENDISRAVLQGNFLPNVDQATLALNIVAQTTGPVNAVLSCEDFAGGDITANQVRITAIKVGSVDSTPGLP